MYQVCVLIFILHYSAYYTAFEQYYHEAAPAVSGGGQA